MTVGRHLLLQARKAGHSGGAAAPVETFERDHVEDLAGGATYVPADEGLFSTSFEWIPDFVVQLQDGGAVWRNARDECHGNSAVIGDGANLGFLNKVGVPGNLVVMRHHISPGTYERYNTQDLAAGTSYTPADEGLFSHAAEPDWPRDVNCEYKYNAAWWWWSTVDDVGREEGTLTAIGDGTNLRYRNTDGVNANWIVIMRLLPPASLTNTFERYHTVDLGAGANYVPADDGLYSASLETEDLSVELQDGGAVWRSCVAGVYGNDTVVGDGTNLRFVNGAGAAGNLTVMRHYVATGTYERYYTADMAATPTVYTPADEGLFSHACERQVVNDVLCEYKYNAAWWWWSTNSGGGVDYGTLLGIGDGTNLRYKNSIPAANWVVIMRHIMIT